MPIENQSSASAEQRFDALRRLLVAVLAAALVGGAIGWIVSGFVGRAAVQAVALLQVGQVGVDSQNVPASVPVEPIPRALERLRSRAFFNGLLQAMGLPTDEKSRDAAAVLLRSSYRVSIPRGSDVIEVQLSQFDEALARTGVQRVVELLANAHARLADPMVASLRARRELVEREIGVAVAERDALQQPVGLRREAGVGNRFAESVLLGNLLKDRDAEIRELRTRRVLLDELLTPARTFPTALLAEGGVALREVAPDRGRGTLGGAVLGGVLGALLVRLSRRRG